MSELDVAKEQIAYLKFWLGVMVVTDISLFGWLISNANNTSLRLLVSGCLAVIAITVGIVLLHRRIERQIQELRGLWLWKRSSLSSSLLCHSCSLA
ncbi:MAG: hypothetical protein NZ578_06600 [Candidatus Binatia bacterium]|nr:hypothetical protein [Candidatus Binatia bacterium]